MDDAAKQRFDELKGADDYIAKLVEDRVTAVEQQLAAIKAVVDRIDQRQSG